MIKKLFLTLFLLVLILPIPAPAAGPATLALSPSSGSFLTGGTFNVSVVLDTKGLSANLVEVELIFPADKLQITNPSIGRSLIQVWPSAPTFSNSEGRARFVGGIPSPGINTSDGVVLTLTFRAIAPGEATISFGNRTRILANDGLGTNILANASPAFYSISVSPAAGPEIASPSHPDPEKWYRDPNPTFIWQNISGADGFSYSIDQNPSGVPDIESEGIRTSNTFSSLDDGLWYFHLRQRVRAVWGGVSHFPFRIDSGPPSDFNITVLPDERTAERNLFLQFFTTDTLSGLDHYELKLVALSRGSVDTPLFFEITSPYLLSNLDTGRYHIIIRAFDKAGNYRDKLVTVNIVAPIYKFIGPDGVDLGKFFIPWLAVLLVVGLPALILLIIIFRILGKHGTHVKRSIYDDIWKVKRAFEKPEDKS
ncbi:MAG: hypothetical protein HYT03_01935 [Candidatus Harrisonbacteria bacterium]|nr:hypothetical protein [Candidatus Harrisonbacteria bacterium]